MLIASSCMVYLTLNPVHSVLFLILSFIASSFILLLFKVEFIAMLFILIYVGAIAILFLFIVMMLNIKKNLFDTRLNIYILIGSLSILFFILISLDILASNYYTFQPTDFISNSLIYFDSFSDIVIFGQSLYNYNIVLVIIAGLILLVAMIGAMIFISDMWGATVNQASVLGDKIVEASKSFAEQIQRAKG